MALIHIKPAPGRLLRNHQRGFRLVPAEGEDFQDDFVVQKRLADGDAVRSGPSGAEQAPGPATPAKPKK